MFIKGKITFPHILAIWTGISLTRATFCMPRIKLMMGQNKIKKTYEVIFYFLYGVDKEYSCGMLSSFTD